MRNKFLALFAAIAMMLGGAVAIAPAANAHVSYCSKTVLKPMLTTYKTKIMGGARGKCPVDGHQSAIEVTTWIEVWAPSWKKWGGGEWRRLGMMDYDRDKRLITAAPVTSLLYGKNKYRTRAKFAVSGNQGTREYDIKTSGVEFNRLPVRR